MSILQRISRVAANPARVTIARLRQRSVRILRDSWRRSRDARCSSYPPHATVPAPIAQCFSWPGLPVDEHALASIIKRARRAAEGEFDLLGSGACIVRHGVACQGLEGITFPPGPVVTADPAGDWLRTRINPSNLAESQRIWSLVSREHAPVDWQLDFRSGFRWNERTWYRDIRYGTHRAADIKLPWELGRCQHFTQMAVAYAQTKDAAYRDAFRNQTLDFIATNPPRWGVQWSSTMDVAIRCANWLFAYDLYRSAGARFDDRFEREFARSIFSHGSHIASNLEWDPAFRGNHYLADLAGLLFAAAYLPSSTQTRRWLDTAQTELRREIVAQFYEEGSNFEGSTAYHSLSADICYYVMLLIAAMPEINRTRLSQLHPVPTEIAVRLKRMGFFMVDTTKPGGRLHQVGDNDSGRFIAMTPISSPPDVGPTISVAAALFPQEAEFRDALCRYPVEHAIASATSVAHVLPCQGVQRAGLRYSPARAAQFVPSDDSRIVVLKGPGPILGIREVAYADFGLFIMRDKNFYLAIRCGSPGQLGIGGHAHNDQLAVELTVDGTEILVDAGTYTYTALPDWRNRFRSVLSHAAPSLEGLEPANLDAGIFQLAEIPSAEVMQFGHGEFVGSLSRAGWRIERSVKVEANKITISDRSWGGRLARGEEEGTMVVSPVPYSPGYGLRAQETGPHGEN